MPATAAVPLPNPQYAQLGDILTLYKRVELSAWGMQGKRAGSEFCPIKPDEKSSDSFYERYLGPSNKWIVADTDFQASFSEWRDFPNEYPAAIALLPLAADGAIDTTGPLVFIHQFHLNYYCEDERGQVEDHQYGEHPYQSIFIGSNPELLQQLGTGTPQNAAKWFIAGRVKESHANANAAREFERNMLQALKVDIIGERADVPPSAIVSFAKQFGYVGKENDIYGQVREAAREAIAGKIHELALNGLAEAAGVRPVLQSILPNAEAAPK